MKSLAFLVVANIVLALGCSSSQTDPADGGGATEGSTSRETGTSTSQSFDTPDAVFAAFASAIKEDDWQSAVPIVTDETKKMLVMGMVMQASFMTMEDEAKGKDLEQLFRKHGITEDMDEGPPPDDIENVVEDLPKFIDDIAKWISANETESEDGFPKLTSISDVKIDGETATGMAETEMGPQPIEFQKVDGQWKVHLATGPPPPPSVDELGLDFESIAEGEIGSMSVGEKSSPLKHAFAYNAKFFDEPCIVLVLSASEISAEKQDELEQKLKEDDGDTVFFAEGPHVQLTLSPDGELMSMFAWIDNTSTSSNRGAAVDVIIEDNTISGRVGVAATESLENPPQFLAEFETDIRF